MKVYIKGEPEVSLSKSNFVAEGGEGKVFARGNTGYKVYHDPAKAIPLGKIQELSAIADPSIIKPISPLFKGKQGVHIGHTFQFVNNTWTLCQLFPRAFREREGFSHDKAISLMRKIQDGVNAVHDAGVLIVDLNEMNFLVSKVFQTPYFIDVDSYQTAHYPATAIMPSVKDPFVHDLDFTTMSDWFSFAIVSFQLLVGIHPFKGKHPSVKGLENRMAAGISIFDSSVKVPRVAYGLEVIPDTYRNWYRALFVDGKRELPPAELHGVVVVRPVLRKISGTDNFEITELQTFKSDIRRVTYGTGAAIVHAGDEIWFGSRIGCPLSALCTIAYTKRSGYPIAASNDDGRLSLLDLTHDESVSVSLRCDGVMSYDGTLYIRNRDKILEIVFTESGNRVVAGSRLAANVLENASKLYDGVVIQNLLGEPHVSLFPKSGTCYQVGIPELKEHKVIQAKFDSGVLMVLAAQGGVYHRYVFRFDESFASYDVRKVEDVGAVDLNFVTLDSGTCVCLNEDERLELFHSKMGSKSVKVIEDPVLGGDMRLVKHGGRIQFYRGNKLYGMKMK